MHDMARNMKLELLFVRKAHNIVHNDLGNSKVSSREVLKMLTKEHKQKRVEFSQFSSCSIRRVTGNCNFIPLTAPTLLFQTFICLVS